MDDYYDDQDMIAEEMDSLRVREQEKAYDNTCTMNCFWSKQFG